jgi:hypothetical protein
MHARIGIFVAFGAFVVFVSAAFAPPPPCYTGCKATACLLDLQGGVNYCYAYDQITCQPASTPLSAALGMNNSKECKDAGTKVRWNEYSCPYNKCSVICTGNPPPMPAEGTCPSNVMTACTGDGIFGTVNSCQ